jgi:hypothetical protein
MTRLFMKCTKMMPFCRRPYSLFFLPLLVRILPSYSSLHNTVLSWNFQWNASLDRNTGKARSYEQSSILFPTQQQASNSRGSTTTSVTKVIESCFQSYPLWLCSKSVTFGLLRANSIQRSPLSDTVSIQDSVFRQNLLIFGKPRRKQQVLLKSKAVGSRTVSKISSLTGKQKKVVEVTLEFPIKGGLLTYRPPTMLNDDEDRGSIRLSCIYPPNLKKQSKAGSAESIVLPFSIESQVVNFSPRISGPPPVSRIRQITYLNTQRLVHAYVMRQFHRHCYRNLIVS